MPFEGKNTSRRCSKTMLHPGTSSKAFKGLQHLLNAAHMMSHNIQQLPSIPATRCFCSNSDGVLLIWSYFAVASSWESVHLISLRCKHTFGKFLAKDEKASDVESEVSVYLSHSPKFHFRSILPHAWAESWRKLHKPKGRKQCVSVVDAGFSCWTRNASINYIYSVEHPGLTLSYRKKIN